jgi:hypothetical protein
VFLSRFAWKINEILYAAPCGIKLSHCPKELHARLGPFFSTMVFFTGERICRPGWSVRPATHSKSVCWAGVVYFSFFLFLFSFRLSRR